MFYRCLDLPEEKGLGIVSWETGDFRSTDHLGSLDSIPGTQELQR